jgi:hypothetical protein
MKMGLALVADNSRPPAPLPGYRQSLSAGTCQRCGGPGVRTVGARRREELHFKKLALCPECVALAREQGFAVIS